jgi:peptide/nickel transport system ATP-binding protein/oligopeptide transport system ATP-binding protein
VIDRCRTEIHQLLPSTTGHLTACHCNDELPPANTIVPSDGGLSPTLTKLIAAFNRTEGAGGCGVGTDDTTTPADIRVRANI